MEPRRDGLNHPSITFADTLSVLSEESSSHSSRACYAPGIGPSALHASTLLCLDLHLRSPFPPLVLKMPATCSPRLSCRRDTWSKLHPSYFDSGASNVKGKGRSTPSAAWGCAAQLFLQENLLREVRLNNSLWFPLHHSLHVSVLTRQLPSMNEHRAGTGAGPFFSNAGHLNRPPLRLLGRDFRRGRCCLMFFRPKPHASPSLSQASGLRPGLQALPCPAPSLFVFQRHFSHKFLLLLIPLWCQLPEGPELTCPLWRQGPGALVALTLGTE